ncbi:Qat anti-phage system QueC-like protein QatC [Dyella terrae]|uniref:Qat anti-phage system QueC-like protein QatC n=1 Tax=Dyella terrae TaxID=522259 RepID=UPI0031B8AA18
MVSRIATPVDPGAFDFLSLSLAVTAADTFTNRREAADGWARDIRLVVALADPARWAPAAPLLEKALRFLSGDQWALEFTDGGETPPVPRTRVTNKLVLDGCESACLYSGGLDSAIGMLNLRAQDHRTVLVSHAYSHDASRQEEILQHVRDRAPRLALHAHPLNHLDHANDVQMRTRSFNFFAMGALAAATIAKRNGHRQRVQLFIPENGLIAINPPLTNRRIGALSTRTTHPHYLSLIQAVLDTVGLPVQLHNPFAHKTKGEMIRDCLDQDLLRGIAGRTVSCGKWKRTGQQCGKCVPCLIRRASFHAAGWEDQTHYKPPGDNLRQVLAHDVDSDDLMAMILASRRLPDEDIATWVAKTGPLPNDHAQQASLVSVVHRGMSEVRAFLESEQLLQGPAEARAIVENEQAFQ